MNTTRKTWRRASVAALAAAILLSAGGCLGACDGSAAASCTENAFAALHAPTGVTATGRSTTNKKKTKKDTKKKDEVSYIDSDDDCDDD